MFVGIREIKGALGRFSLIVGVVGLITLLVVMLTGLTAGLGKQNTSALEALDPQSVTFNDMDEPSYSTSRIPADEVPAGSTPLGTGQTMLTTEDGTEISAAVLGLPKGTVLPTGVTLGDTAVASSSLGLTEGEEIGVGGASISVDETADDLYYSHSPVLWVPTETWQAAMHTEAAGTVLLNSDDSGMSVRESFNALPAYGSEQGSLKLIQGFLYAIAALVTVAFLTVWTIQRTRDLSILRALGASSAYLRKDALGQAALILAVGVIGGGIIALGLGLAAAQVAPFSLSVLSIIGPQLALWVLGMAGAWLATRSITKIDPQQALGGIA
ncbi:ABC transporter permease [Corynebacterium sanguinis]|uniref:ABC transporter permease n=1 Tax=Corynebacterium sanguinis TaxID=2594913 RepID=A0A6C1TWG9_9CORY|nr:ABC transporter permease [Corynebacterium sanguinis]MCT1445556.1 ABC transporter permease [Corynebacterium sanguinis]MCT1493167.1 ABC transporter permease [Corynebacterium sanguinis]MCT1597951.1 ABC transporter permease [Corynebacterium sanguinis]MCT1614049.1 ABC transporter permease [Corynebacterium sanguinis]MCT1805721.1 ABC transporter permease [Corynebacterium sanguinis]